MPRVGDLLSGRAPLVLSSEATALAAARAMTEARIKAVLVSSPGARPGEVAGIFTEHDLMTRVVAAGRDPRSTRLADVMTRELFTISRDRALAEARLEMQRRHISHVPVVEGGAVVGVLSLGDLLRADIEVLSYEVEQIEGYFLGGSSRGGD
jgi:signal-transduction protein with cAMP-binding, CBS, and nucleotidyltransferase domain